MSLNKFTDINQTKQWMRINCQEIKCSALTAEVQNIDELNTNLLYANEIESKSVIVNELEMPSLDNATEYTSVQTNNNGVLFLRQQLPALSYSYSRGNSSGAVIPLALFSGFTEPDTDTNDAEVKSDFVSTHPKGLTINKSGTYRCTVYIRAVIGLACPSNYGAILVNGNWPTSTTVVIPSIGGVADLGWNLTEYIQLTAGQRISPGLATSCGGNTVIFGDWIISCEFIK